jgi:hypothetical protein
MQFSKLKNSEKMTRKLIEDAHFLCHKAAVIAAMLRTQLEVHSVLFSQEIRWHAKSKVLLLCEK